MELFNESVMVFLRSVGQLGQLDLSKSIKFEIMCI